MQETYGEKAVLRELADARARYWIVHWQGASVGILRLNLDQESPDHPGRPALKLHRVYLHPRTHGHGIGRTLMDFTLAKARELNKAYVWLEAMDTQAAALAFYKKMGFETTGTFRLTFEQMEGHWRGMVRMTREV
jgi:ribosomal protein S18 acetylase RimI-like enzyme